MVNFNQFMQQAQVMQKKMQEMQEASSNKEFEGKSGGGLVNLIVNGRKEMVKINIDTSLLKSDEKEILEDLIIAAFNDATKKADQDSKDTMAKAFGNIPLPPGFKMPF